MFNKTYEVWCWKAPYSDDPNGWTVQYFTSRKDAYEYAAETVAEEIHVDVMQDIRWVNDHIEQEKVETVNL